MIQEFTKRYEEDGSEINFIKNDLGTMLSFKKGFKLLFDIGDKIVIKLWIKDYISKETISQNEFDILKLALSLLKKNAIHRARIIIFEQYGIGLKILRYKGGYKFILICKDIDEKIISEEQYDLLLAFINMM